ncbi:MAG: cysteine--tRNA ligase [Patescibacteria group bacterium]
MALTLYNSLSRQSESFAPLAPPVVSFYTCGPTVYDVPHIGNLRTFVTSDLVRRVLERAGYTVRQVVNITDVDDKTIAGARAAKFALGEFTKEYEDIFLANLESLNLLRPAALARAAEVIEHMIVMVEKLLEQGTAYAAEDGIYFKIKSFPSYGVFQKPDTDEDFALWKFWKPEDGEVSWEAPFGKGRPGWHLECSAMIAATLGQSIDLHLGGTDLTFPHHENERAQSESFNHAPLSKYWLHSAFVNINGEKMSKSLGNIIGLKELEAKGFKPLAYRYLLLTAHYRTLINFTWESLGAAAEALNKLENLVNDWQGDGTEGKVIHSYFKRFNESLDADFNLPQALGVLWEMTKDESEKRRDKLATLLNFDQVLGLNLAAAGTPTELPPEISDLIAKREEARARQDWLTADTLRQKIESLGYSLKDTNSGPKFRKI